MSIAVQGGSSEFLIRTEPSLPKPWGFWSTSGWFVLASLLTIIIAGVAIAALNGHDLHALQQGRERRLLWDFVLFAAAIETAILVGVARLAGWRPGEYLGLDRPRRRDLEYSIAALLVLLAATEVLNSVAGRDSVTPFQIETYRVARANGLLPLMWIAMVVIAPISEEIVFRGFLFRGWAASPLGVTGTIFLTSLIWAAVHTQYDWFCMLQIFGAGLLLGVVRWLTRSTTITTALHMLGNFIATVETTVVMEWLG